MRADPAWKSALLHKGQDVADLLEAVLSGKSPDLSSLPVPFGPDQDPELRLRNFLEQIDRAIVRRCAGILAQGSARPQETDQLL